MAKCIYCLCQNVEFSTEHVITKGLGTYGADTWTIPKSDEKVCKNCNTSFGVTIDLELTNDSHEGITRVDVLKSKKIRKHKIRNISISYPEDYPDERVRGVRIDVINLINNKIIYTRPQVHIFNIESGKYDIFFTDELEKMSSLNQEKYDLIKMKIFASTEEDLNNLIGTLKRLNISFEEKERFFERSPANILDIKGVITKDTQRAIAKIAFNYIAKFYPTIELTLSNFDPIREFILNGTGSINVSIEEKFLADETKNIKLRSEGAILIGTEYINSHLKVRIQIYSTFTYLIDIGTITLTNFQPIGFLLVPDKEPEKLSSYQKGVLDLYTIDSVDGKDFFWRPI
jgi:hypothetical protein